MARRLLLTSTMTAALLAGSIAPASAAPPVVEAARASGQTTLEASVIQQLNIVRADPAGYAKLLRMLPGSALNQDAAAFLDRQSPKGVLTPDPRLAEAASGYLAQLAPLGSVSHTGPDGSRPRDRMLARGVFTSVYAELISTGERRAADVVRQLVIDPPGPAHPHRLDIFDPLLTFAGVGCGPSKAFGYMCVVDLSATPMTRGEPPPSAPGQPLVPQPTSTRFVPDEVLVQFAGPAPPDRIQALVSRLKLEAQDRFTSVLTGDSFVLLHIPDQRSPPDLVRDLGGDAGVVGAQPNFLFDVMAQEPAPPAADYAAGKLRLSQAHQLARGQHVLVGVVDTGVDFTHPELKGAIVASFDAIGGAARPDSHGTGISALIAGHGKLTGAAPAAQLLVARAFRQGGAGQGTSFSILKAVDWTAARGARVINMSFAGPQDPALHRLMEAAAGRGIVLVAAAGNAGPKSPPLYPAADPAVIAVAATDAEDRLYAGSNSGDYIALAAPGVDLLTAAPQASYQVSTGTSMAAAEVSGVVALMLERRPRLSPEQVRRGLGETARPLAAAGPGPGPGPRIVDAYRATAAAAPGAGPPPKP
ncbi:MAG: S8 family serine peptidase [Phenylobacterium sp.]